MIHKKQNFSVDSEFDIVNPKISQSLMPGVDKTTEKLSFAEVNLDVSSSINHISPVTDTDNINRVEKILNEEKKIIS